MPLSLVAARGQGRAIALAMAAEGANIACFDICKNLSYPNYDLASMEDMEKTVAEIEALGREALAFTEMSGALKKSRLRWKKTIETLGQY